MSVAGENEAAAARDGSKKREEDAAAPSTTTETGEPPPSQSHELPETLPPVLEDFLSRYPHPAFALRASSLFDALVLRSNPFAPAPRDALSISQSHSNSNSSGESKGQAASAVHPAEDRTETGTGDGATSKPAKPARLSSREQYEGMISEEELLERRQDEEDEARNRDQAESELAAGQGRSRSGSAVNSSLSPSIVNSPPPSTVSTPALDGRARGESHSGRERGGESYPPSVSQAGTPTTISALSGFSSRRAADVGPRPRAHARAERVLAETFSDKAPEYGPPRAGQRKQNQPLVRSTLLEGGAQKSHDPSRTAEGAVKAMYEQREQEARAAQQEEERVARDEKEMERIRNAQDTEREAETKLGVSGHRTGNEIGARGGDANGRQSDGAGAGAATTTTEHDSSSDADAAEHARDVSSGDSVPAQQSDPTRAKAAHQPAPAPPPRRRSGPTVGLREILTPVWRNDKWRELMAIRDDAKSAPSTPDVDSAGAFDKPTREGEGDAGPSKTGDELELLGVLSRTDAQECLSMLSSVVETLLPSHPSELERQKKLPLAQLNHTVLVELNFPESSIYRHPPGSSFHHEHTASDSFARDASVAGSSLFFSPSVSAARDQRRDAASGASVSQGSPMPSISEGSAEGEVGTPPSAGSANGSASYFPRGAAAANAAGGASAIGRVLPATTMPLSVPPSNQNPAVPPPHHTVQQESRLLRPFVQIVATLYQEYDLVICTTISANIPLPVTVTGSPGAKDTETAERERTAAAERKNEKRARQKASQRREGAVYAPDIVERQRAEELEVKEPPVPTTPPAEADPVEPRKPAQAYPVEGGQATAPMSAGPAQGPDTATILSDSVSHARPGLRRQASSDETSLPPQPRRPQLDRKESSEETRMPTPRSKQDDASASGAKAPTRPPLSQRMTSSSNLSSNPSSAASTITVSAQQTLDIQPEPDHVKPLDSPSGITAELRALLSSESGRDIPSDVLQEKESRAALRRRGISHQASQREIDNVFREREWARRESRRQHKKRSRSKQERPDQAGAGGRDREGLEDLHELDETKVNQDGTPECSSSEGEEADRDGILGFDEEDDDVDLDRLRRATRTGSTSSAGSAKDREEAQAEAQLVRDQHDEDEEKLEIRRELTKEREARAEEGRRRAAAQSARAESPPSAPNSGSGTGASLPTPVADSPPRKTHEDGDMARHRAASLPQPFDTDSHVSSSAINSTRGGASRLTEDPFNITGPVAPITVTPPLSYGDPFFDFLASTDCGRTILTVDWAQTCLGPIKSWTQELRSHVMATLASPFHTALWLGEESVLLYNDAYARLLGAKHPAAMVSPPQLLNLPSLRELT